MNKLPFTFIISILIHTVLLYSFSKHESMKNNTALSSAYTSVEIYTIHTANKGSISSKDNVGSDKVLAPAGSVPVGYLYEQGHLPLQAELVDHVRELPPQLLRKEYYAHRLVLQRVLEGLVQLLPLVHHHAVHAGKTHTRVGIHIITDEIHFHTTAAPGS